MKPPRYAIGIDLGTTNCVLAYVDLQGRNGPSRVLPIPQVQSPGMCIESPLLPSYFYYPTPAELDRGGFNPFASQESAEDTSFVTGAFARDQMNALPGRVIYSAKSWLAHGGIDREAHILPFGSDEIAPELKLSPVETSAAYLEHLKEAWNHAFAREEADNEFSRQRVIVTVPASFDEGAQALTRMAAELAGYPETLRLLEEPQAAFYAWIEAASRQREQSPGGRFLQLLPELARQPRSVLVCDIGGGTSDFSLFRIAPIQSVDALPEISRIATSDHLLLGGDNIDLALAHLLERQFKPDTDERLSRRQWSHLVPQARLLKEKILEASARADELFHVSVPGEGASLFQAALSTSVTRSTVQQMVLDGFFPLTRADERPRTRQAGLREIGLPYAVDSAISRHLAAFLGGRQVDAVLFAGGTLKPDFLQERLLTLIGGWQGTRPVPLPLQQMSLAIAQGAAYFGALPERATERIRGGYARSVYLEVHRDEPAQVPKLVCVLPQGFEEGATLKLDSPRFTLLLNRPVRFSAYTSNRRPGDKPGTIVASDVDSFHPLPSLHTTLALEANGFSARKAAEEEITVGLQAQLTELGVLQLALVNDTLGRRWRLEFNLRKPVAASEVAAPSSTEGVGVAPSVLDSAIDRIALFYGKKQPADQKDGVRSLVKSLEQILGQERNRWGTVLLRSLWPALYPGITRRGRSVAHENAWLYLAGFVLRPGYGVELDAWRMNQLWECFALGMAHRKEKSVQANWWMMWRRTAGGLSAAQQQQLYEAALPQFMNSAAEFVEGTRLLGALESVPVASKLELAQLLFGLVLKGKAMNQAHIFWALTRLLSRVSLHGAAESVVPAAVVEEYFARVEPLDWKKEGLQALIGVFSAGCRLTSMRALDIHDPIRARVLDKLKRSGAREAQLRVLREYSEVSAAERDYLFGEQLPSGLKVANDVLK